MTTLKKDGKTPLAGKKFDADKNRLDLIPMQVMEEIGKVLTIGAQKYGKDNWKKGMKWSRLQAAALRHYSQWSQKEAKDPETGLSHLAHMMTNILFLMWYEMNQGGEDDRS